MACVCVCVQTTKVWVELAIKFWCWGAFILSGSMVKDECFFCGAQRWEFIKENKKVRRKKESFSFFLVAFLVESVFFLFFFSWWLSFFLDRILGRERVFFLFFACFLDRFLGRVLVFLFSYFLAFFHKFSPHFSSKVTSTVYFFSL